MLQTERRPLTPAERTLLEKTARAPRPKPAPIPEALAWGALAGGILGLVTGGILAGILFCIPSSRSYSGFVWLAVIAAGAVLRSRNRLHFERDRYRQLLRRWESSRSRLMRGEMQIVRVVARGTIEIRGFGRDKSLGFDFGEYLLDIGDGQALFLRGEYGLDFIEATQRWEEQQGLGTTSEWPLEFKRYPDDPDAGLRWIEEKEDLLPPITRTVYWRNGKRAERWRHLDGCLAGDSGNGSARPFWDLPRQVTAANV